ncbi:zinc metalloprotease ZmpB [Streptococcus pneumoniae]|nr:zinc metalloprotease ZmpB [Streptococcus pneumoniae]
MDGYRYVGYLSGDILKTLGLDTVLEETSAKPGEVTVVEVETPQSTTNQEQARTENQVVETEEAPKEEAPKTEESPKEEPKSEVKPTDDTLPKVEEGKEDSAEPAPVEEVGGEVESKSEEKVAVKPESQPSDKPAEESKVEPPVEQAKVPEQPVQPTQAEQPSTPKESSQQENPKEDRGAEETPKQEDEQPAEAPEIKVEEPVESKEETKTAKGTQEKGHVGEALAQEQLPEYKVTEGTLVETSTTDLDYKTETTEDPTKYTDEETVLRTGEEGSQVTKTTYKTVEGVKTDQVLSTSTEVTKEPVNQQVIRGTKPIEGTLIEESLEKIPFKEVVKEDDQLKKGLEVVAQEGKEGQKKITKTFNTIKGVKTEDAPKVTEEILEEPQDKILKRGTKSFEKPVLTITEIESKDLKRTSDVKYSLENPSKAAIKSITLTLKKGDEIVKTLNVSPEDLTTTLTDLQYYKDYKLETKMVYDRGEGDEEEVLKEEPLRIDLKKVEIKDIIRTDLIKYENQVETDETRLTSVPTDLSNYYLKVTSNDHKTNLLAVQKIEESTIDGKQVYKVIAVADNLVQRNVDNRFEETYTYYIEKPKASQAGIFYDFEELIQAIQTNPAGEFKLGQSMSARNVVPKGKSYITSEFTGKLLSDGDKRYAIHNLEHPLFDKIKAGTVKNINFENIDIDLSNQDNIAAIANEISGTTRIENIKAIGTITARNNVAGFVNNIKEDATLENVAFIGSINSAGNNSTVGGIAGSNYMGFVNRAYVDATITANNANASMLVPFVQYKAHSWLSGTKGKLTNSVAKGILDVKNTKYVGGITSKTWPYGAVQDNVTYAKVIKGQEIFGSNDVNDGDANPFVSNLFGVIGYSSSEDGTGKDNKNKNKLKHLSKSEADAKVASFNITAAKFVSEPYELNKLNNVSSREAAYESIQDYNADYKLAYKNIEKLQPFYNKDFIVNQANKLDKNNKLNTKEILSVTPMNNNNFVTDLGDANKIIVHYADGTKDYFNLSSSDEGLSNVREYTITDLGIKYTPNIVQKDHSALINGIVNILSPIELQSNPIYQKLGRTGSNRVNAIKDLYLEESFDHVKANLNILVTKLVENEDHQLNNSSAAQQMILDKVEKNKAALLLGLTYLNRYYGVKFGDVNIKELMLFKPDFYGKNVSVLDRLIEIGSREDNIKGHRTYDAFSEIISKTTLSENLVNFLNYNRRLFTADVNIYDWFKKATEGNVYIAERASEVDEIKAAKYKVWDNLQSATHRKMILPLLNLNKSHVYLISNYSAMAVGTAEKLGHSSFDGIKNQIEKAADSYRNYFDFWYRLSLDKVKNMLVKNTVTPLWEGYQAPGGWPDKYGKRNNKEDYAPLRELFGPIGKYYGNNGTGAYAVIWDNPLDTRTEVNYIALSMIDEFGISVYTHETTHVNDRAIYLGGYGRRSGTHAEAYAQGMLQTPVPSTWFDEYGALGINMTFYRPNDGNQWYITDPKTLKTREDIDNYMKGYIDTLSLLDYVEGDAVISKHDDKLNQLWFKKVDPIERTVGSKDQYDKVRNMSSDDWKGITLNSVNDLVDNNLMTNRMMNNNIYKPEVFDPGIAYVGIKMMNSIYAGNTSEGAPGAVTFKNNAFRLWGYYGYDKGFLGYASDKLKSQANKEGKQFGDQYIIQKISDGRFQSFADFKKEYYKELLEKANAGFTPFTIDGETIHNYDELKSLFAKALEEDMVTNKVNGKLVQVKEKVYKKLLQQTNSFKTSIFK